MALQFDELVKEYLRVGGVSLMVPAVLIRQGGVDAELEQDVTNTGMVAAPRRYSMRSDRAGSFGTVYPLVKREGSAFEHIGIGRASNVDVQLPLIGVSKYHAYMLVNEAGQYLVADAGSQNGTRLTFQQLEPRQPVRIESGARIYFAHHLFTFATRDTLVGMVRAQALSHPG